MTSPGSSYKFTHSLRRRLQASWWLTTIMVLSAFLAGPILTFFRMKSAVLQFEQGYLPEPLHDTLIRIFKWDAFIGQYFLAIGFGVILAALFMAINTTKSKMISITVYLYAASSCSVYTPAPLSCSKPLSR